MATTSCDLGILDPGAAATLTVTLRRTSRDALRDGRTYFDARITAPADDSNSINNETTILLRPFACSAVGTQESDTLTGTAGRDSLCGLDGADRLSGLQGRDLLRGGPGSDRLIGGAGNDTILARDGERDTIDCGPNTDTAIVDRLDRVARNCENVLRNRP